MKYENLVAFQWLRRRLNGNIGKVFNEKGCWFAGGINPLGYYKVEVIGNIYSNPELLK